MRSTQQQARFAEFLYLLLALTAAPAGLLYFPGKLIVYGNATATADNIFWLVIWGAKTRRPTPPSAH